MSESSGCATEPVSTRPTRRERLVESQSQTVPAPWRPVAVKRAIRDRAAAGMEKLAIVSRSPSMNTASAVASAEPSRVRAETKLRSSPRGWTRRSVTETESVCDAMDVIAAGPLGGAA